MGEFHGNDLAKKILEKIKPYSCFSAILLETQCKKMGKNLELLELADLPVLADAIEKAVATFASPGKGKEVKQELLLLIKK